MGHHKNFITPVNENTIAQVVNKIIETHSDSTGRIHVTEIYSVLDKTFGKKSASAALPQVSANLAGAGVSVYA